MRKARIERAILAGLDHWDGGGRDWEELEALVDSAGGKVVGKMSQRRREPDPALFMGKGKIEALREEVRKKEADLVIFDQDLTPVQVKNLEEALGVKVLAQLSLFEKIFLVFQ